MNKLKFLTILSIGLLLSNLLLIGFMLFKKTKHQGPPRKRDVIIGKLKFDDNQIKEYDKIIIWHQNEITKTEGQIRDLKKQLYSNLTSDTFTSQKDSLINELGKVQNQIENIHYKHFEDIRNLCNTPSQREAFNQLTKEIATIFAPPPIKRNEK